MAVAPPSAFGGLRSLLHPGSRGNGRPAGGTVRGGPPFVGRVLMLLMAVVLSFTLTACQGGQTRRPPTLSNEDLAVITRQAEGFLAARDQLPELASLVNARDWIFTRNLIHGPMQEVGRQMLYINRRLLPGDRPEAEARARRLKTALAELDEAARLQDADKLRTAYIKVASDFGLYAQLLPREVQIALKQV